jgi:hypothetical protein
MNKFALNTVLSLVSLTTLSAQLVPDLMSYQGQVVDSSGNGIGSGTPVNRKMIFRIFDAGTAGNRLWSEEQTVTIANGVFSVLLGQGVNATYNGNTESPRPSLRTIFGGTERYMELVVDNGDGTLNNTDAAIAPRQRLVSSAFAMRAATADAVTLGTDLNLRDANHGLGWYGPGRLFNGVSVDGPVLYGFSGGALGTNQNGFYNLAVQWNSAGKVALGTGIDTNFNTSIRPPLKLDSGQSAPPSNGVTGGNGSRVVLSPGTASSTPYAIGLDSNVLWNSVPSTAGYKWYSGTNEPMSLSNDGNLAVTGRFSSGGIMRMSGGSDFVDTQSVSFSSTLGFNNKNIISFGHPGQSEDYIGYQNNTFYMRDTPGGGDTSGPNLEVGGQIKEGSANVISGNANDNLRIIRGIVDNTANSNLATRNSPSATLSPDPSSGLRGYGYRFRRLENDVWTIEFTVSFNEIPTVTVTPIIGVGGTRQFIKITEITTSQVTIQTNQDDNSAGAAAGLSFIVIGD